MEIKKVGNRGILFTFHDLGIPTNVYTIIGSELIYIVDTYLGPVPMTDILKYIDQYNTDFPRVVINTHSHWDHVWGNCLFPPDMIYAHISCRRLMEEQESALETYSEYKRGCVKLVYPGNLFYSEVRIGNDNVLIYSTPGHSEDSITVYDEEDKVLFAGDNLERPIPYFSSKDLQQYVNTLEEYATIDADYVIGGHTSVENKDLIFHNLSYVKKVLLGDDIEIESKEFLSVHQSNISFLQDK